MSDVAIDGFGRQRRTVGAVLLIFLLSGCGGSDSAPQQAGASSNRVPTEGPPTPTAAVQTATVAPPPTSTAQPSPTHTAPVQTATAAPPPTSTAQPSPTPTPTGGLSGAAVVLDRITAPAGARIDVNATLRTNGAQIDYLQFDVGFAPQTRIHAKNNGKPDCVVNPEIDKGATSFAFLPLRCSNCKAFRTIVLSGDNLDAIPDGTVLVTCKVDIAADAMGTFPLTVSRVAMDDPNHPAHNYDWTAAQGVDGSITVSDVPMQTPSPGPPAFPTATAAPPGTITQPSIVVSTVSAAAGSVVSFAATLVLPNGEMVIGTQNDVAFPSGARVAATTNGKPDCQVNPDIRKDNTTFAFRPLGCAGATCTGMRSLVISVRIGEDNDPPIASGAVLYTCKLEIAADAEGTLPLSTSNVVMSDPDGNRVPGGEGIDGVVTVSAP